MLTVIINYLPGYLHKEHILEKNSRYYFNHCMLKRLRLRKVKYLAKCCSAKKWSSWDLNLGLYRLKRPASSLYRTVTQ